MDCGGRGLNKMSLLWTSFHVRYCRHCWSETSLYCVPLDKQNKNILQTQTPQTYHQTTNDLTLTN